MWHGKQYLSKYTWPWIVNLYAGIISHTLGKHVSDISQNLMVCTCILASDNLSHFSYHMSFTIDFHLKSDATHLRYPSSGWKTNTTTSHTSIILFCLIFYLSLSILPCFILFITVRTIFIRKRWSEYLFCPKSFFFTVPFPSNSHHTITSIYFTVFMFILPRCSQMPALKLFSDHKHPSAFFSIQNNIFCS